MGGDEEQVEEEYDGASDCYLGDVLCEITRVGVDSGQVIGVSWSVQTVYPNEEC